MSPREAYIAAVEEGCRGLPHKEAEEIRVDASWAFRKNCPPPNPASARQSLRPSRNSERTVLGLSSVHKQMALAVMDTQDYLNKAQHLSQDRKPY